jgi:hypothetical protein
MADVVKPAKHGRDHCPGGEDPIPCLGTIALLSGWEAIGTGEIAAGIWTNVTADGFYNDGYTVSGNGISIDLDTGSIGARADVLYLLSGYIKVAGTFAQGEILSVAVTQGSAKYMNQLTAGAMGALSDQHLTVAVPVFAPSPSSYGLSVYHDTAADDVTLLDARLTLMMMGPLYDVNWIFHA